ncbi:TniB family NTP-binding protein [Undibacterium sp. TS12]|uniref:TniB family NTP-binding protein n=1 Tax=Undibacterium sp. TS12 TaxID=2908202 RepID=UPI001F4D3414|nr:TniB family NTP-binding protein [Undibacterium sp. TS12]MCH8618030.1 TniB family NTP-binding protein [Undibacterium sp. TS12]
MIDKSDKELRIKALEKVVWIGYPRAIHIRGRLDSLLSYERMHRMPNLAIVGESNNGKTMLLNNFCKRANPETSPLDKKTVLPVLMIQTPPEPDENRLYDELLTELFANGSPREPITTKKARFAKLVEVLETRLLIFDEFQHMLAGSLLKQRKFLNAIKYLGNLLQISCVVSGTPETLNALQADPQIANRFEPVFLPKWKLDADFLRLLVTLESLLGLKETSNLAQEKLATLLLATCEGNIGELCFLLRKLATYAINSGEERITENMFKAEILKAAEWTSPSNRNRSSD